MSKRNNTQSRKKGGRKKKRSIDPKGIEDQIDSDANAGAPPKKVKTLLTLFLAILNLVCQLKQWLSTTFINFVVKVSKIFPEVHSIDLQEANTRDFFPEYVKITSIKMYKYWDEHQLHFYLKPMVNNLTVKVVKWELGEKSEMFDDKWEQDTPVFVIRFIPEVRKFLNDSVEENRKLNSKDYFGLLEFVLTEGPDPNNPRKTHLAWLRIDLNEESRTLYKPSFSKKRLWIGPSFDEEKAKELESSLPYQVGPTKWNDGNGLKPSLSWDGKIARIVQEFDQKEQKDKTKWSATYYPEKIGIRILVTGDEKFKRIQNTEEGKLVAKIGFQLLRTQHYLNKFGRDCKNEKGDAVEVKIEVHYKGRLRYHIYFTLTWNRDRFIPAISCEDPKIEKKKDEDKPTTSSEKKKFGGWEIELYKKDGE